MKLNIVEDILTKNDCYKVGKTISPIGLQLHTIGTAQNTSASLRDYWNQSGVEACVHYCVDAESEGLVRHFLPDNRRSWGDGGFGNANLITVELMESDYMKYTGGANYTVTNESKFKTDVTKAYNTAVYFFAYKCKQYGWNPLEKMSNGLYRISSHDEGRRLGLSTAHVDPTHIWNRYGWTMDQFRKDVKKVMDGGEISIDSSTPTSEPMTYFVRKTFTDSSSQLGAYSVLDNAKKMVDQNPTYKVFDAKGKVIYGKSNTSSTVSNNLDHKPVLKGTTDKIWMGWLKRESGTKGYRCVLGDSGAANSAYQFDYRYALVPFMQYCVDKFPSHYDGFKKYIAYGAGNSNLRGNTGLANLWLSYCDKYWDEFCSLQDSYAYIKYYLEAKKYIKNLYGIEMDNHSPVVKGTLFSMAIRSGSLTGARKFAGCNNKTSDVEMLRISYSTYGSQDANRWAQSGQYGDALAALKNNEYTSITVEGSSTPSQPSTPSTPNATSKTPYRVATSYNGGKYVGQIDAYNVLDNAKKRASEASQSAKKTYYVYDNTGTVVYTAEYKTSSTTSGKITKVSEWISVLKNYGQKMVDVKAVYSNSGNKTDYEVALKQKPVTQNCALYLTHSLAIAGLFTRKDKFYGASDGSLKGSGVTTLTTKIGKIIAEYPKGKMKTDNLALIPGDIVTYYGQHTNVYIGTENGKKVWYDFGRGTSVKGCTGSTWKSFKRTGEIGGMHVAKVIRLNLLDDVSKKETTTVKPSTSTPKKLYDVKVTITDLRIREAPNGKINGYIKPGVYGITEEKTVGGIKWGHLLSGSGWIALDYVTKL